VRQGVPGRLIALGGHREPGQKIKILDYFDFNLSRCSFCGLCAEVCPTKPIKALIMSEDYELRQLQPGYPDSAGLTRCMTASHRTVHALKNFSLPESPRECHSVALAPQISPGFDLVGVRTTVPGGSCSRRCWCRRGFGFNRMWRIFVIRADTTVSQTF